MSDGLKFDWFDAVKTGATAVATAVVGVLVRLLFGRAMKGIDDSLALLAKSNVETAAELKGIRTELADYRTELAVLKAEMNHLKSLPVPVGGPK